MKEVRKPTERDRRQEEKLECFVIMPISEREEYGPDHFRRLYEDVFKPACVQAGFVAVRADDVKKTNMIVLDVLEKLISAPMAICDLSTRNPNVMFELGVRQAFDKPVVLVQEVGTPPIFDIQPLRYIEYRRELLYQNVLGDQQNIAQAIRDTYDDALADRRSINSLVRLLSLAQAASIPHAESSATEAQIKLLAASVETLMSRVESSSARSQKTDLLPSADAAFGQINNYYQLVTGGQEVTPIELEEIKLFVARMGQALPTGRGVDARTHHILTALQHLRKAVDEREKSLALRDDFDDSDPFADE